ncbi:MAG: nuclear transport factor 2 family protein [Burkholderiaceae bacterium]|nr:nuclear transport factor 2 family protein [Burkholderiaceae bacterium]
MTGALTPEEFIAHEAALLDERRFDDWLALFAEDGRYWVPLQGAAQADEITHNSIALEDRLLLALRVRRLKNPRAHSQHPASHCQHILQRPQRLEDGAGGELRMKTPFLYVEARGPQQLMLAGTCVHRLCRTGGGAWLIREKRVNLLNPGQPLPAIQLFI